MKGLLHRMILAVLSAAVTAVAGSAHDSDHISVERGLLFKSYEVVPAERTSMAIPSSEGRSLVFSDSLRVSFSIRTNLSLGRFGYICRVLLSNRESVDMLLYTPSGKPTALCATGDHENLLQLPLDPSDWQDVELLLTLEDGVVSASMNGQNFASVRTGAKKESVTLCFGKNAEREITTSDVAPMIIRDLNIRADRHKADFRSLEGEDGSDGRRHRYSMSVTNPLWMRTRYCSWNRIWSTRLPDLAHICTDEAASRISFVSKDIVESYYPRTMTSSRWITSKNIRNDLVTNDFVSLPDGTLAYLDIDVPGLIRFDESTHDWSADNMRKRHSVHLYTNTVYDRVSGTFLCMFGYGQHRYSDDLVVWNPSSDSLRRMDLQDIPPRYLAATGIRDRKVYIFGGKGNPSGAQELGIHLYGDLWTLDMDSFETQRLWDGGDNCQEVAASNLIFDEDGKSFYALVYNPNVYESSLQLKRFNLADGSSESFGAPLPYHFLDIESEARLVYNDQMQSYLAIVAHRGDNGEFEAVIYSIGCPVMAVAPMPGRPVRPYLATALVLFAILAVVAVLLYLRRRRTYCYASEIYGEPTASAGIEPAVEISSGRKFRTGREKPAAPSGPCVGLIGGFRVTSVDGKDLGASFSPLMKQLLCLLVLSSTRKGGISNSELKDALWFDKSDESYNNNRGVTLKKIRTILSQVDPSFKIVNSKGRWSVEDPGNVCDYLQIMNVLGDKASSLDSVLKAASCGMLLPELRIEWLDPFKAEYENLIISRLASFRPVVEDDASAEMAIRIADALLTFDRLDEESVRQKCQALVQLKRTGSAKRVFDSFAEEYRHTMDEDLSVSFTDFIKNQGH